MVLTARPALLSPASALARAGPRAGRALAPPFGCGLGLDELERLDVEQALALADDVGVTQRLEELLRPLEVAHANLDRAEALRHVAVRAGAGHDPVLGREPGGLLVERRERHPGVEHLDGV